MPDRPSADGPGSRPALARLLARAAFEIFPLPGVEERAAILLPGTKVTVTSSPTRGIDETLALTERLRKRGMTVVPHIAARLVEDKAHAQRIVERLAKLGITDIFVIGGDVGEPVGRFSSALSLLAALEEIGHPFAEIGVAGYPEGHPLLEEDTLNKALGDKQPFATYVVTQMCFDPNAIVRWLTRMRGEGIELPAHIGIPGATKVHRLLRFSLRIGVGESTRFVTKHSNLLSRLAKSTYRPDDLILGLEPHLDSPELNTAGFHLYTFNQVEGTERWRRLALQQVGRQPTKESSDADSL